MPPPPTRSAKWRVGEVCATHCTHFTVLSSDRAPANRLTLSLALATLAPSARAPVGDDPKPPQINPPARRELDPLILEQPTLSRPGLAIQADLPARVDHPLPGHAAARRQPGQRPPNHPR